MLETRNVDNNPQINIRKALYVNLRPLFVTDMRKCARICNVGFNYVVNCYSNLYIVRPT